MILGSSFNMLVRRLLQLIFCCSNKHSPSQICESKWFIWLTSQFQGISVREVREGAKAEITKQCCSWDCFLCLAQVPFLQTPEQSAERLHCPLQAGHFHINQQLRKCSIDMPRGQSDVKRSSVEVSSTDVCQFDNRYQPPQRTMHF